MSWEDQEAYGAPGPDDMFVIEHEDDKCDCGSCNDFYIPVVDD